MERDRQLEFNITPDISNEDLDIESDDVFLQSQLSVTKIERRRQQLQEAHKRWRERNLERAREWGRIRQAAYRLRPDVRERNIQYLRQYYLEKIKPKRIAQRANKKQTSGESLG